MWGFVEVPVGGGEWRSLVGALISQGGQVKLRSCSSGSGHFHLPHKDLTFLEWHLGNECTRGMCPGQAIRLGVGRSALVLGCILRQVQGRNP